ncbi:hypothetical protein KL943_001030 [Ogataea angusta]|nr:hypothetical protein KL943_001030 [Ogataea angusta]
MVVHCEFHRGAGFDVDHERAEADSKQNVQQRRAETGVQARERESQGRERAVGDEVADRVAHGEHREPQHGLVDAVDGAGVFQDVDDLGGGGRDEVEHVDEADERRNGREQTTVERVAKGAQHEIGNEQDHRQLQHLCRKLLEDNQRREQQLEVEEPHVEVEFSARVGGRGHGDVDAKGERERGDVEERLERLVAQGQPAVVGDQLGFPRDLDGLCGQDRRDRRRRRDGRRSRERCWWQQPVVSRDRRLRRVVVGGRDDDVRRHRDLVLPRLACLVARVAAVVVGYMFEVARPEGQLDGVCQRQPKALARLETLDVLLERVDGRGLCFGACLVVDLGPRLGKQLIGTEEADQNVCCVQQTHGDALGQLDLAVDQEKQRQHHQREEQSHVPDKRGVVHGERPHNGHGADHHGEREIGGPKQLADGQGRGIGVHGDPRRQNVGRAVGKGQQRESRQLLAQIEQSGEKREVGRKVIGRQKPKHKEQRRGQPHEHAHHEPRRHVRQKP